MTMNYNPPLVGSATSMWKADIQSGTVTITVTVDLAGMKLDYDHWDFHRDKELVPVLTPEGLDYVLERCWFADNIELSEPNLSDVSIRLEYDGE